MSRHIVMSSLPNLLPGVRQGRTGNRQPVRLVKLIGLFSLAALALASPPAVSQQVSAPPECPPASQAQTLASHSGQVAFHRGILGCLWPGLSSADYTELFDYLHKALQDPSILHDQRRNNWELDLHERGQWRGIQLRPFDYKRAKPVPDTTAATSIPLYPFVRAYGADGATLTSFHDLSEPRLEALPESVRDYVRRLLAEQDSLAAAAATSDAARDENSSGIGRVVKLAGQELRQTFPELVARSYWIVSHDRAIGSRITALDFDVYGLTGKHQIRAHFREQPPDAIFAYQAENETEVPRLTDVTVRSGQLPYPATEHLLVLPGLRQDWVYAGSIENTSGSVGLVWDATAQRVRFLDVRFGYDWGNHSIRQDRNYFLQSGSRRYVLRMAAEFAELLVFAPDGSIMTVIVGDETAPEI